MKISKGTLALAMSTSPYVATVDGVTGKSSAIYSYLMTGQGNGCTFSPDGSKLAVATNDANNVLLFNTGDWTRIASPSVPPTGLGLGCAFSADGSKLAVSHGTNPNITVYNTADWSKIPNPSVLPPSSGFGCAFSADGAKLAVAHAATPFITIYNTADWSKIANPATLPTGQGNGCAFSPDGAKLAVAHSTPPFLTVYNTGDWSKIPNPGTLPAGIGNGCAFSPDGTKLAVAHATSPFISIYTVSNWSKIGLPLISFISGQGGKAVAWRDNRFCLLATGGIPSIVEFDVTTGTIAATIDMPGSVLGLAVLASSGWAVNGTIEESLAASNWIASAYDHLSGTLLGTVKFSGTTFSIPVANPLPVTVTVSADQGSMWVASELIASGVKRFPTNPVATPYYYSASSLGTTGVSEPSWPVTVGGTVVDGTVTWTRVERLIQPFTQSPLIPTPV